MLSALRQYNYRLWAGADLVSVTGTWMQVLGVNWYVLQVTGSATRMGFTVLLQALPVLLLGPFGGALADRVRPRPLLLTTQAVHVLLAVGLAAAATHPVGLLPVYVITLLTGVVNAIEGPVLGRFGTMVVGPACLGGALATGSLISSTGRIIGVSLGGVVVAAVGPAALFGANALSFLAVIGALLAMRPGQWHPVAGAAPRSGVRDGFGYLLRQPTVLVVLGLAFVLGSLGRNYQVTMAAMSAGPLHAGARGYGLLSAAFAAGTVAGALIAGQFRRLGHRLLVGAGAAASLLQLASGLSPGLLSFAAVMVPVAALAVLIDTTVATRVQLDTREDMRGRVIAATGIVSSLSGMAGAPLLGLACEVAGARVALILAGGAAAVACVAGAGALARLRRGTRLRREDLALLVEDSVVPRCEDPALELAGDRG